MPVIKIDTFVNAPVARVFDLSRSIDLHKISTADTNEEAIAGVTTGLIGMNEWVTWKAKHFGIYQTLTSKITAFDKPKYFVDEMTEGAFKRFRHEHIFTEEDSGTIMTDVFDYTSPMGILGSIADQIFLKSYMTRLLEKRNAIVKEFAETDRWRDVLR